jgi:hypothetical protein
MVSGGGVARVHHRRALARAGVRGLGTGASGLSWSRRRERAVTDQPFAALLEFLDPAEAFRTAAAAVPGDVGLDAAWAGVPDSDARSMVLRYFRCAHGPEIDGLAVQAGQGLGGKVLATGKPGFVADYLASTVITHHFDNEVLAAGLKSMIAVPVAYGGRRLGVLFGSNRTVTDFGGRAIGSMLAVAGRAAAAAVVAERARQAATAAVLEDRHRLALDLHDSVGAMLFAITAGVRCLGEEYAALPDLRRRLDALEGQAVDAASMLRRSVSELSSPPEQMALAVMLRSDAKAFEDRTGSPTRVILLTDLPPLRPSVARALSDSVREALLNVEKHANARCVGVTAARRRRRDHDRRRRQWRWAGSWPGRQRRARPPGGCRPAGPARRSTQRDGKRGQRCHVLCLGSVLSQTAVRSLPGTGQSVVRYGLLPLVGALFNLLVFVYGLIKQAHQVSIVAGVLVALCFVWAVAARFISRTPYFTQATVAHAVGEKPSIDGGGRGDAFRNRRRRWSRPDRDPGVTRRMRVGEVLAHRRVVRVRRDRDQGEAVAVSAG